MAILDIIPDACMISTVIAALIVSIICGVIRQKKKYYDKLEDVVEKARGAETVDEGSIRAVLKFDKIYYLKAVVDALVCTGIILGIEYLFAYWYSPVENCITVGILAAILAAVLPIAVDFVITHKAFAVSAFRKYFLPQIEKELASFLAKDDKDGCADVAEDPAVTSGDSTDALIDQLIEARLQAKVDALKGKTE